MRHVSAGVKINAHRPAYLGISLERAPKKEECSFLKKGIKRLLPLSCANGWGKGL
jgi:hypothetical protein